MRFTTWALASCLTLGLTGWASDAMAGKGKPAPPPPPPPPAPIEPPARAWHAFAGNGGITSSASRLYLIGGAGSDGQALGDFWYYRRDTATWTVAPAGSSKPGKRQWVGFSCGAGQCVTSNGNNGVGLLKETWTYTEATGNWSQVNCKRVLCPSARHMATMAYAEGLGHLLFGGRSGSGLEADVIDCGPDAGLPAPPGPEAADPESGRLGMRLSRIRELVDSDAGGRTPEDVSRRMAGSVFARFTLEEIFGPDEAADHDDGAARHEGLGLPSGYLEAMVDPLRLPR